MEDEKKKYWDLVSAALPFVGTLAVISAGLYQFNRGEEDRLQQQHVLLEEQDTISFRRRLWLDRLDAYRSLGRLVGEIIANAGDPKFDGLEKQYVAAYWGTTVMVEDKAVERAMINFRLAILDYKAKRIPLDNLKLSGHKLVQACRQSATTFMPPT